MPVSIVSFATELQKHTQPYDTVDESVQEHLIGIPGFRSTPVVRDADASFSAEQMLRWLDVGSGTNELRDMASSFRSLTLCTIDVIVLDSTIHEAEFSGFVRKKLMCEIRVRGLTGNISDTHTLPYSLHAPQALIYFDSNGEHIGRFSIRAKAEKPIQATLPIATGRDRWEISSFEESHDLAYLITSVLANQIVADLFSAYSERQVFEQLVGS